MQEQETIFRQKSIDRVSSPEQLDKCLKVTSPSVWIILIGVIFILVGTIAWGAFGKINSYSTAACVVSDNETFCYLKEKDISKVEVGMNVEIIDENKEFPILAISTEGVNIPDTYSYLQHILDVTSSDFVFGVSCVTSLQDGYYKARVITDSISPLQFIFN